METIIKIFSNLGTPRFPKSLLLRLHSSTSSRSLFAWATFLGLI